MNAEQRYYFDKGVEIGKVVFRNHLKGDSYKASLYNDNHAEISLRTLQIQFGTILPFQQEVKRGIKLGVLTGGLNATTTFRNKHDNIDSSSNILTTTR